MKTNSDSIDRITLKVRHRGILGALILLVVGCAVGCSLERAEATRQLNQGLAAMSGGDTSTVVTHLEAALEADPGFAEAAYYLGQVHQMRNRNFNEAARFYRRANDLEPENPRYAYRLGTVLAQQDNHAEAIRFFDEAVGQAPDYARAWFAKGLSQEAEGEFGAALDSYMEAIRVNPRLRMTANDPGGEHYHALGDLYVRFRLFDHAVSVYENGFANNPQSPRLSQGLGTALMGLNRPDDAVRAFENTLELDAQNGPANFNLTVALRDAGRLGEAIAHGEKVLASGAGLNEARGRALELLLEDLRLEREDVEDP